MKGGKTPLGYTIIEVMIVLAVSGGMFLIAANFINGKQAKTAFTQGTNETASQIQNVIEQVSNGKYSDIPLNCTFDGTTTTVISGTLPSQGTNPTCTFLGKLLRFSSVNKHTYKVLSLAGGRADASGGNPTLASVHPVVITDLTNSQDIAQQLDVAGVSVTDLSGVTYTNYYNFGFSQGLGSSSGGSFQSGAQTLSLVYSPVNLSDPATPDTNANGSLAYAQAVTVCLTDGTRYARILIGSPNNDSQLSVKLQVVTLCP
jgi:prepilin-type N-terminal cleavage/methylation domain-containing protein